MYKRQPVAFAADGTPIALASVAEIERIYNPQNIRRQDLQRREGIFAGVKDRSPGDVAVSYTHLACARSWPARSRAAPT